jgi:DNA excision repair protein ERCC-4
MTDLQPVLIQDSREQLGYGPLFKSPYIIEGLPVGDYSVAGLQDRIAIERKSIEDLVGSLTHGRERFERELSKGRTYQFFAVVVEGSAQSILRGDYGPSRANPAAIWESIAAFTTRYCPFHFLGDRRTAARWTESILLKFAREHLKAVELMTRASLRGADRPPRGNSKTRSGEGYEMTGEHCH